ncbi:unnamed protein product [Lasius platythorax]|uniref:Uncharacterized protein n=1 Tax=Lasius platythorax TaxID=488582 RepID=A0AAV2NYT7_9HYME
MFKYMRRNIGTGYLRNMPTGIGRHAQVLSKCSRRYIKYPELNETTLEGERALFGANDVAYITPSAL